jgi:serine/threonine-protein kinase
VSLVDGVHRVRLVESEQTVALKVPRWEGTLSNRIVDQFVDEAETWDELDGHDGIVDILDWGATPHPWMVLEFVPHSLEELRGDLELAEKLDVLAAIADGLEYAHSRGIVHLDIKPSNILMTESGTPKVADWGLARVLLEHTRTEMGLTPAYSAPEQLTEEYGDIERETDVYQLGVLAYQLVTGQLPYDADRPVDLQREILETDPVPPAEVNPRAPDRLNDVVMTALSKEQADRYEAALLFRDAIREVTVDPE